MRKPVFKYLGDTDRCHELNRYAKTRLNILRNEMQFQGLQQHEDLLELSDGSIIYCRSVFGRDEIVIYRPVRGKEKEKKPIQLLSVLKAVFLIQSLFAYGRYFWLFVGTDVELSMIAAAYAERAMSRHGNVLLVEYDTVDGNPTVNAHKSSGSKLPYEYSGVAYELKINNYPGKLRIVCSDYTIYLDAVTWDGKYHYSTSSNSFYVYGNQLLRFRTHAVPATSENNYTVQYVFMFMEYTFYTKRVDGIMKLAADTVTITRTYDFYDVCQYLNPDSPGAMSSYSSCLPQLSARASCALTGDKSYIKILLWAYGHRHATGCDEWDCYHNNYPVIYNFKLDRTSGILSGVTLLPCTRKKVSTVTGTDTNGLYYFGGYDNYIALWFRTKYGDANRYSFVEEMRFPLRIKHAQTYRRLNVPCPTDYWWIVGWSLKVTGTSQFIGGIDDLNDYGNGKYITKYHGTALLIITPYTAEVTKDDTHEHTTEYWASWTPCTMENPCEFTDCTNNLAPAQLLGSPDLTCYPICNEIVEESSEIQPYGVPLGYGSAWVRVDYISISDWAFILLALPSPEVGADPLSVPDNTSHCERTLSSSAADVNKKRSAVVRVCTTDMHDGMKFTVRWNDDYDSNGNMSFVRWFDRRIHYQHFDSRVNGAGSLLFFKSTPKHCIYSEITHATETEQAFLFVNGIDYFDDICEAIKPLLEAELEPYELSPAYITKNRLVGYAFMV